MKKRDLYKTWNFDDISGVHKYVASLIRSDTHELFDSEVFYGHSDDEARRLATTYFRDRYRHEFSELADGRGVYLEVRHLDRVTGKIEL